MTFPSDDIRDWCFNIDKLIKAPRENKTRKGDYGPIFCACEIERAIQYCPRFQQPDLVNGLFWSAWIDQVFYYVTIDGGVRPYLRSSFHGINSELYRKFRQVYPFPKLEAHSGCGQITPSYLLSPSLNYDKPSDELLSEGKKCFWGRLKDGY